MPRHRPASSRVLVVTAIAATGLGLMSPASAEPHYPAGERPLPASHPASAVPGPDDVSDYCGDQCRDILPPGQNGNATIEDILAHRETGEVPPHSADQLDRYAALATGYRDLTDDGLDDFFVDSSFGVGEDDVESVVTPRSDVTIVRDKRAGVPHVHGTTRSGTEFGAGYAAAQDRLWVMDVLRHAGRGTLTSFAGGAEANRQMEQQFFATAPYTEAELERQLDTLAERGPRGEQVVRDIGDYIDGVNAYLADAERDRALPGEYVLTGHLDPETYEHDIEPFQPTDVVVLGQIVGAQFGGGGGGEVEAALAKLEVQQRYGVKRGERVWQSLRNADDPEAVRTLHDGQSFPYGKAPAHPAGRAMPDVGTVEPQRLVFNEQASVRAGSGGPEPDAGELEPLRGLFADGVLDPELFDPRGMSNALVVSGEHTADGNPIAVFGPQIGYLAPQLLLVQELQGPGISARGASFAGLSMYVLLGRGQDYAWSATSAGQDVTDTYAVELCSPDGSPAELDATHYRFHGECREMTTVERHNTWQPSLADPTEAGSYTLRSYRTVYGPVTHRARVDGAPVAYSVLRSSYHHEADSLIGLSIVNDPERITSATEFQDAMTNVSYAFNWFYVDSRDTAYYNSGDNPVRHPRVDPSMPVWGDSGFDWRDWEPGTNTAAYTPPSEHPNSRNQDYYISWNNAQAKGYAAAKYEKGSVHRADLLDSGVSELIASDTGVTRADLTRVMAESGVSDLRGGRVLPTLLEVVDTAEVNDPDLTAALDGLRDWLADGALRVETGPGSRTYAHSDAVRTMDAWWPLLVRQLFEPKLGKDGVEAMARVLPIDEHPNAVGHGGSAFQVGWWGYVDKDLRSVLGESVPAPLGDRFCGDGDLADCRESLLGTLATAVAASDTDVYPGDQACEAGDQWCADTIIHQPIGAITHAPIGWQNRGTYQQVVEFPRGRG